MSNFSDQNYD